MHLSAEPTVRTVETELELQERLNTVAIAVLSVQIESAPAANIQSESTETFVIPAPISIEGT
jgi:hypothetical protein